MKVLDRGRNGFWCEDNTHSNNNTGGWEGVAVGGVNAASSR